MLLSLDVIGSDRLDVSQQTCTHSHISIRSNITAMEATVPWTNGSVSMNAPSGFLDPLPSKAEPRLVESGAGSIASAIERFRSSAPRSRAERASSGPVNGSRLEESQPSERQHLPATDEQPVRKPSWSSRR